MKKFITSVLALMLFSSIYAQQANFELVSRFGHWLEDQQRFDDGVETIVYDEKNNKLVYTWKNRIGVVNIDDPANPKKERDIYPKLPQSLRCVAVQNGVAALVGSSTLELWDVYDGLFIASYPLGNEPDNAQFSPDGKYIVVANEGDADGDDGDGSISIFDISNGLTNATETRLGFSQYTIDAFRYNGFEPAGSGSSPSNWNFTFGPNTFRDTVMSWKYNTRFFVNAWAGEYVKYIEDPNGNIYYYMVDRNNRWANNGTAYYYTGSGEGDILFKNIGNPTFNPSNQGYYSDFDPVATNGLDYEVRFSFTHGGLTLNDSFGYIVEYNNGTTWNKANFVSLIDTNENYEKTFNTARTTSVQVPGSNPHLRVRFYARFEAGNDSSKFAYVDNVYAEGTIKGGPKIYVPQISKHNKGDDGVEPEYVAITADSKYAFVTLQENNSIAKVNLQTKTLDTIYNCGFVDFNKPGYEVNMAKYYQGKLNNFNMQAIKMPDGITSFEHNGQTYFIAVNEGEDGGMAGNRGGFGDVRDPSSIKGLDSAALGDLSIHSNDELAGDFKRFLIDEQLLDQNGDSLVDHLCPIGGRNFTIYDINGNIVHEGETFDHHYPGTDDQRALGHEPEGVTTGMIDGHRYAFMVLERAHAMVIYNIDDPFNPFFVQKMLVGTRPEYVCFISADKSPTGKALIVTANEDDNLGITIITTTDKGTGRILKGEGLTGITKVLYTKDEFYVTTGRGPASSINNGSATNILNQGNQSYDSTAFFNPSYQPHIYRVRKIANSNDYEILDSIFFNNGGNIMDGLPSTIPGTYNYTGEQPVDASLNPISGSNNSIYPGAIAQGLGDDLWVGDKYGARILRVNSKTGNVVKIYTPWGNTPDIDTIFRYARALLGITCIDVDSMGKVYATTEFPIDQHMPYATDPTKSRSKAWRLMELDPTTDVIDYYGVILDDRLRLTDMKLINNNSIIFLMNDYDNEFEDNLSFRIINRQPNAVPMDIAADVDFELNYKSYNITANSFLWVPEIQSIYPRNNEFFPYGDFEGIEILDDKRIILMNNNNSHILQYDYRDAGQLGSVETVLMPYAFPTNWFANQQEIFEGVSYKIDYDRNLTNVVNETHTADVEFRVYAHNVLNKNVQATIKVIEQNGLTAADYDFTPVTFTVNANSDSVYIFTFKVKNDNLVENAEDLQFELINITEVYDVQPKGKNNAFKIISDDMLNISVNKNKHNVKENGRMIYVAVEGSNPISAGFEYKGKLTFKSGSAVLGTNIEITKDEVVLNENQSRDSFAIRVIDNNYFDFDKNAIFEINGTVTNVNAFDKIVDVAIEEDDAKPTIGFDKTFIDVAEDAGNVSLNVVLSALSKEANTATISVIGGDAVAGKDYNLSTNNVTFAAQTNTAQSVNFTVNDDTDMDGDKTVILSIENINGVAVAAAKTVTITIRDNDLNTAVREILAGDDVAVYPNPATTETKVVANRKIQVIQVTDLQGKTVASVNNVGFEHTLNLGTLSAGLYMVKVQTTNDSYVMKLQVK